MIPSTLRILIGIATVYAGVYVGQPLYCDCNEQSLYYSSETEPWIALDVKLYETGWADCGDDILVFTGGSGVELKAYDAGPLYKFYIADYPQLPIIGDIPVPHAPFRGLSGRVRMINLTSVRMRLMQER